MSDDSGYRKILRLMGRGRDSSNNNVSLEKYLGGRFVKKDEYLIRNGAYLFKGLVKSTHGKNSSFSIFSLKELRKATNNFSVMRDHGDDGIPPTYTFRGVIEDKRVAVKVCSMRYTLVDELLSLSLIKNRNVVKVLGCCLETENPIVVHELPPNGTIAENISKLSWTDRLRVATEIADVLAYLHSELHMTHGGLFYFDAVLLDEFLSAKLGAFRLSEIQNQAESSDVETDIRNKFRKRKDVDDFGNILLDLLGIDGIKVFQCKEKVEILKYVKVNVSEKEMPQIEAYIDLFLRCRPPHPRLSVIEMFDHYYERMKEVGGEYELSIEEVVRELRRIRSMINHQ